MLSFYQLKIQNLPILSFNIDSSTIVTFVAAGYYHPLFVYFDLQKTAICVNLTKNNSTMLPSRYLSYIHVVQLLKIYFCSHY